MLNPIVSIVIPAFNVEEYIVFTLDSVKGQILEEFECIIVDDCSTDKTKSLCSAYIKGDKRFKMISHRANGGLSAARNTGLRAAKGKYVCFLDSDDLFMENSLSVRVSTLESNKEDQVIGTYCGSLGIKQNCETAPESSSTKLRKVDFIVAAGNCPFNANQPMFYLDKFIQIGGFDHSLKQAEDYDMWMRVLRHGYQIVPTNQNSVTYRATPGSMVKKDPMLHLETSFQRFSDCYGELEEQSIPVDLGGRDVYLEKGLSNYIAQLNIANRVLEFVGISLAVGNEFGLAQKFVEYLPDYFRIIESHRPFANGLLKGVKRGGGYNDENNHEKAAVLKKISDLRAECLHYSSSVANIKDKVHVTNLHLRKKSLEVSGARLVSQLGLQSIIDIVFIPHKDYHVATIAMMKESLLRLGLNFVIVDISMHYRDEGAKRKAVELDLPLIGYSNFLLGSFSPKLIVSFNDWDPIVRSIVVSAQDAGLNTAAIVEGIQDYDDADTGQKRDAYRTVDTVFLPGEFDSKYFGNSGQTVKAVGIPRIHELRHGPQNSLNWDKPKALINSNFSYGVLENSRDQWVRDSVEACLKAGFEPVISRHPADTGTEFTEYQTSDNFYDALRYCSVHISKFASGILEALAVGCPVIYFNPHKEMVDKFKQPLGAYNIIESKSNLVIELHNLSKTCAIYLENSDRFLDLHAGPKIENSSEMLALFIRDIVEDTDSNGLGKFNKFRENMLVLDSKTGSFNNIQYLRESVIATYSEDNVLSRDEKCRDGKRRLKLVESKVLSIRDYHKCIGTEDYHNASQVLKNLLARNPKFALYQSLVIELAELYDKHGQNMPNWLSRKVA